MGYVLKAVLSSAQHPEYGQITVPFPIVQVQEIGMQSIEPTL